MGGETSESGEGAVCCGGVEGCGSLGGGHEGREVCEVLWDRGLPGGFEGCVGPDSVVKVCVSQCREDFCRAFGKSISGKTFGSEDGLLKIYVYCAIEVLGRELFSRMVLAFGSGVGGVGHNGESHLEKCINAGVSELMRESAKSGEGGDGNGGNFGGISEKLVVIFGGMVGNYLEDVAKTVPSDLVSWGDVEGIKTYLTCGGRLN